MTAIISGTSGRVVFEGTNIQDGDHAAWVAHNSTSCSSAAFIASATVASNSAVFALTPHSGQFVLCYRHVSGSEYTLFSAIRLVAIRVDDVSPSLAPAISRCDGHAFTIVGDGFSGLRLPTSCLFEPVGEVNASVVNDTHIRCEAPVPSAAAKGYLSIRTGSASSRSQLIRLNHTAVFYDPSSFLVNSTVPRGAAFNLQTNIWMTGSFPLSGPMLCRIGEKYSAMGEIVNTTHVRCTKPVFANSDKQHQLHAVRLAPTGECFLEPRGSFVTYNAQASSTPTHTHSPVGLPLVCPLTIVQALAQVTSLNVKGGPLNTSSSLMVSGAGFPRSLTSGGWCWFNLDLLTLKTPAHVLSEVEAACTTPPFTRAGTYTVYLSLNGQQTEPTRSGSVTFEAFDLSSIRLSGVTPACFAVGYNITLTVEGRHFAEYGSPASRQLVCKVGDQVVPVTLLNSSFLQCAVGAFAAPGVASVSVSLNGGSPGTFSPDELFITAYQPPTISRISPLVGDADGGELVTILGSGFDSSCASELRCAFGGVLQPQAPSVINGSRMECLTTWGQSTSTGWGVSVGLSLDHGITLHTNSLVRFEFRGFHRPQLVDAYFSSDATRLIMKFDPQPTNQAGLGGLGRVSCDLLLDETTSDVLRGSASLFPDCIWTADAVVALLTVHTAAAPGLRVGFKPATIWPAGWSYPGSCAGQGSKCNTAASSQISIQSFFPCDMRDTPIIEACMIPTASIRAPDFISSCSNASLTLRVDDLSSSSSIKPLRFTWGPDPISCDNFYPIQAKLDEQNAAQATTITLDGSLLAGGQTFVFWLQELQLIEKRVLLSVFTGQAPGLLYVKVGMSVSLTAEVLLPPCLDTHTPTITYAWNNSAVTALSPMAPARGSARLRLDPLTRSSRALNLAGSAMVHGFVYTLRVTCCFQMDISRCDFAEVDLAREKEALRAQFEGGQARSVGVGSPLSLNSCSSCIHDATEGESSCAGLLFEWSCVPLSAAAVCPTFPLGRQEGCEWSIGSNSFKVGNYSLSVNVTTLLFTEQSAAQTRLEVIESDISVAITTNMNVLVSSAMANANERLHLTANVASDTDAEMAYAWSIASEHSHADFSSLTSTGLFHSNLVLLPGVLRAGASYTFRVRLVALTRSHNLSDGKCHPHQVDANSVLGGTASSWLTLKANAPPFGGTMSISPEPPYLALLAEITVTALQWFDDPEDMPLLYSFFYADSPQAADESWTPISEAKLYPSQIWRNPPAGNFTIICKVMDTFGAKTGTQRKITVEQQAPLNWSSIEPLLLDIETRNALGDPTGAVQLIDSLAITLNSQCSASEGSAGEGFCSSLRGRLIDSLARQLMEGISLLAIQQRASSLSSLVSRPSELAIDAMEQASLLVGELLRVSRAGVSSGTAAKLLGSISSLLGGTSEDALEETSEPSLNLTNCSGCVAALRSERLRNHTVRLAELIVGNRAVGEAPTAFSTPTIAIRARRDDPCRVENTSFEAAPFEGGGGRGQLQAVSSCGETSVSLFFLTFKSVARAVSPLERLATPVYSVQVKQCGEEWRVSETTSPIQLRMMPFPHTSPSRCPLPPVSPSPSSPSVAPNDECASGNCTEHADCHAPGVTAIQWNTFSIDDVASVVTTFNFEKNRAIYLFFLVLAGTNVICLVWLGWYREHRSAVARKRKTALHLVSRFEGLRKTYEHDAASFSEEPRLKQTMLKDMWKHLLLVSKGCRFCAEHTLCSLFNSPEDNEALTASQERIVRFECDTSLCVCAPCLSQVILQCSLSQMIQLLFNALMVDLVFACFNAPDATSSTGGGRRGRGSAAEDATQRNAFRIDQFAKIDLIYATVTGLIAAIGMSMTTYICSFVFRWGNSTQSNLHASGGDAHRQRALLLPIHPGRKKRTPLLSPHALALLVQIVAYQSGMTLSLRAVRTSLMHHPAMPTPSNHWRHMIRSRASN
ncbi:MAG: hypothetical protein SGPRY_002275 [Prymnesium sp.]